jgi:hypothetical protein
MFRSTPSSFLAALLLSPLCVPAASAAAADPTLTFALQEFGDVAPGEVVEGIDADHSEIAASYVRVRRPAPVGALPSWHPPLEASYVPKTRYDAVSYRPRGQRPVDPRVQRWRGVGQLHAGVFDPDGPPQNGFNLGFRAGHELDQMLQIGVGLDWRTRSGIAVPATQTPGAPVPIQSNQYSSNLLPVLAYLQLQGPNMLISPYVGVAGSWQVLFLSATDAVTGQHYDATFTGWGWQAWAGAGFRVAGRTRLIAEVFMNEGSVGRDIYDPNYYGPVVRETIRTDGFGARYGVCWGF